MVAHFRRACVRSVAAPQTRHAGRFADQEIDRAAHVDEIDRNARHVDRIAAPDGSVAPPELAVCCIAGGELADATHGNTRFIYVGNRSKPLSRPDRPLCLPYLPA